MALYGIILVAALLIALAFISASWSYSSNYAAMSNQSALYSNLQKTEAFDQAVALSRAITPNGSILNWLAALRSSAVADQVNLSITNSTGIVSSEGAPKVAAVLTLNS